MLPVNRLICHLFLFYSAAQRLIYSALYQMEVDRH